MLRRLTGIVIVSLVLLAYSACSSGVSSTGAAVGHTLHPPDKEIGNFLYQPQPKPAVAEKPQNARPRFADPIVIDECRLTAERRQDVPAQKDGVIAFIGTLIEDPAEVAETPKDRLVEITEVEQTDGNHSDELQTDRSKVQTRPRYYKMLRENDQVSKGQLLARLDDQVARDELAIKRAKVNVAKNDVDAAEKTKTETFQRYLTAKKLHPRAMSDEEVRAADLLHQTKTAEWLSKKEAFQQAKHELNQAHTNLKLHEIRARIPGLIKTIYKKEGEAVRNLEPVFQILNLDELRAEGLMGRQYLPRLHEAIKSGKPVHVVVEAPKADSPIRILKGHTQEITSVAVGQGGSGETLIASTSEDGYIRVWSADLRTEEATKCAHLSEQGATKLPGDAVPTAVACAGASARTHRLVCGASDGVVWVRNMVAKAEDPPHKLDPPHRSSVTCVALSPDGGYAASAGEDRLIHIWDLNAGTLKYSIPEAHSGTITTLQFTQCSQLLSAGRDNCLCIWTLGDKHARRDMKQPNRSGDVLRIGTSPDGTQVLFDHANELQVLSIPQGLNQGYLQRPSRASSFSGVALFSPDGDLILTSTDSEHKLELWRAPTADDHRGWEVCRLITEPASVATCAAFAPSGSFIVTGHKNKDLCIWTTPGSGEWSAQVTAQLETTDPTVESSTGQVRVRARVLNSELRHNTTATLVIETAR